MFQILRVQLDHFASLVVLLQDLASGLEALHGPCLKEDRGCAGQFRM